MITLINIRKSQPCCEASTESHGSLADRQAAYIFIPHFSLSIKIFEASINSGGIVLYMYVMYSFMFLYLYLFGMEEDHENYSLFDYGIFYVEHFGCSC